MSENVKRETNVVETTGQEATEVKRKISFKRILIFGGILLFFIIVLVVIICLNKPKSSDSDRLQSEGTSIAGIPFSDILAKVSVETTAYSGTVIPVGTSENTAVEIKAGDIKVTYSMNPSEALIFDRDGLAIASEKKEDDFIIGGYATSKVSLSKKDSDIIYCEDAETIARVLRYNFETQEMVCLWENDLVYDQFLPITAITNIAKFNIAKTKPVAADIYDESKVLVEVEKDSTINHFGLDDGLDTYQVAIIQTGKEEFTVMSQNYIDTDITVEGPNHYIVDRHISRILIYDYEKNFIELVYQN